MKKSVFKESVKGGDRPKPRDKDGLTGQSQGQEQRGGELDSEQEEEIILQEG